MRVNVYMHWHQADLAALCVPYPEEQLSLVDRCARSLFSYITGSLTSSILFIGAYCSETLRWSYFLCHFVAMQKDVSRTGCFMCCLSQFINMCETSQEKGSKGTLKLILVVRSLMEELIPWADRAWLGFKGTQVHMLQIAQEFGGGVRIHPADTPLLQVLQEGRSCAAGLCTRLSLTSRQTRGQERSWRNVLPEIVLFSFLNLINFCCCCLFLRVLFNYISPFSFLPSNPSIYSTLLSFNLIASFFHWLLLHAYMY